MTPEKNTDLPDRKTMRRKGFDYNSSGLYFLTICTKNRKNILSDIVGTGVPDGPLPEVKLTPYGIIAEKYLRQMGGFYDHLSVDLYVIMPNHIHILLRVDNGPSRTPVPTTAQNTVVARFVSTFKRFCNKEYGTNVWQARSFDHIVRNNDDYIYCKNYILNNPRRWRLDELYAEN